MGRSKGSLLVSSRTGMITQHAIAKVLRTREILDILYLALPMALSSANWHCIVVLPSSEFIVFCLKDMPRTGIQRLHKNIKFTQKRRKLRNFFSQSGNTEFSRHVWRRSEGEINSMFHKELTCVVS